MAELHPQKENYLYSEVYNDSTKVTTITNSSTDVKYVDTDSGLCTRTTGHFDSSESHVVFDKGSYYLGVYHENFGIIEEDGDSIEIAAVSYRTNGINAQFNESYCIAAYVGSEQLTSATFPGSSTSITIPRNTSNSSRNIYITTKQVYSNLICGQGVDQGGVVEQHGAWDYRVTYTFVNTSTIKDTVTPNGNVDNTKYPNIPATTQIKFQLEQTREGGGYSPTTHCIYEYLDWYNTQPNPEWSSQLGNGNYWNITVGSGTQQTGTAQIVSVEFEQGTDVHTRQERNPNYDVNAPAGSPNSNYYITVTYTRRCWYVDHCIVTVKGNSTKYGNYTGNTIDTLSTTTVDINGNWTGQPNYSLPGNWSGTAHLKVKDNHPIVDYKLELTKEPNNGTGNDTTVLCINNKRGAQYKSTLQCTVKLSQCTSIGYVGMPQNQLTWTAWEEANTSSSNFTWSSNKTNVATVDTNGKVTVQYANWAANDTNVTITVSLNNSTLNKQGIAYNTAPGGLKSTLTKTTDNKTYIVLGRLDEYVWRIYGLTPTPSNKYIYDKDDSISGHTPKQVSYAIKLQYQKNGNIGTTAWTDYSTQVSKFKWTGDTVAIPTSETSGIYNGINKNYYDGKKSDVTSHYISGNIKAKANFIDNNDVKFTDNKHVVYGTSEYHVIDSKTVVNALEVTDTIYVYGYITYYTISIIASGSNTGCICYNNSRSHHNPVPTQSVTFSVTIKTKHRSGTTTNYSVVDGPNLVCENNMISWTGGNNNYFTLSGNCGSATCSNAHSRFETADQSFNIIATFSNANNAYNIDSVSIGSVQFSLTVCGRENEYEFYSVTHGSFSTINQQGTSTANVTAIYLRKNGSSNINIINGSNTISGTVSVNWHIGNQTSAPAAYISISPTSGNSTTVTGTNNYYQYTRNSYDDYVGLNIDINVYMATYFSDNSSYPIRVEHTYTDSLSVSVIGYPNVFKSDDFVVKYVAIGNSATIAYNGNLSLTTQYQRYIRNGTTSNWNWVTYGQPNAGGYGSITSNSNTSDFSTSGLIVYTSGSWQSNLTSIGTTSTSVTVTWSDQEGVTHNASSGTIYANPAPDQFYTTGGNFTWGYTMNFSAGESDYDEGNELKVYKNNGIYIDYWPGSLSYDLDECVADIDGDAIAITAPTSISSCGRDGTVYWSVSAGTQYYPDRNYDIYGNRPVNCNSSDSFAVYLYDYTLYIDDGSASISASLGSQDDFAFSWEHDYGGDGPCGDGDSWGGGTESLGSSKPSRLHYRVQAEWEIDGHNGTQTKSGNVYISWSGCDGYASLPDLTFYP